MASFKLKSIAENALKIADIDISAFTNAPLKMVGEIEVDCDPQELWPLVTDPNMIASWFPIVTGGQSESQ